MHLISMYSWSASKKNLKWFYNKVINKIIKIKMTNLKNEKDEYNDYIG